MNANGGQIDTPDTTLRDLLFLTTDSIKPDCVPSVFDVAGGFLPVCFDACVTTQIMTAIAKRKPYYAVFRDGSLVSDSIAADFDQIFETYSPQL